MTDQTAVPPSDETLASRIAALTPTQRRLLEQIVAEGGHDSCQGIRRRPQPRHEAPVSFEQERLWYMNELVSYRTIFHVPLALRLRGELDLEAFRRAVAGLVERHEALRTVFRERPDGLRQVVLETVAVELEVEDCREAADPEGEARRRGSASVFEPFDLGNGPLARFGLYQLGQHDHLLVLTQHHIVSDYWSLGILLGDLGALYAAERGIGGPLPPVELHYPDFAHWQRSTIDRAIIDEQLVYWRDQLADAPEILELPTDRPRPAVRRSQGRFHHVEFGADEVGRLRQLVSGHSTTLLVGFLATYVALLSRLTRQDEVVVGVPIAGRSRPELQDMLGYFLSWLAIRVSVGDRPSLRQLVERTATAFTEAMAHQDVPFEMLVQELQQNRRPGVTPVFQTSLSLRDAAPTPPQLPGIEATFADLDGGATHFDLMAELWCEGDRVVGYLPYDDELFDEATVASYATWMARILDTATAEPDRPVATLPLLTGTERAALVGRGPTHQESTGQTLHGQFSEQVARQPTAIAVSDETSRLSYRELDGRANRIANVFLSRGVGPGELVGLVVDRSVDLVAAILGVLKCGAAYLPIDPDSPTERMAGQLAGCSAVVVTGARGAETPADRCPTVAIDWSSPELAGASDEPVAADVPASSPAYVIYTSGSTGVPKGVVVSHANVVRLLSTSQRHITLGEDDVWTLFHSYAFDFSVWELWGALLLGGRVVVVPQWMSRAPDACWELIQHEHVTVLSQTPSAFGPLAKVAVADQRPSSLRYVVFGGEALEHGALRKWFDAFGDERPRVVNMYGITETTVHVTFRRVRCGDVTGERSLIGESLDDLALYVLDDELQPVPPGVVGEIFVGGSGVVLGYLGAPALTAERMIPDPFTSSAGGRMYRSGDLAIRRRDGELVYVGRSDDQHKIRGHRVEVGEVQAALRRLDDVHDGAVLVTRDRVGAKTLVAYVMVEDDRSVSGTQIRRNLLRTLPEWMTPSSVVLVDELPLTQNGKLDRRALLARRPSTGPDAASAAPPQGATAAGLTAIWSRLLGVERIGADDNFFDLGGHSLMVVQLVAEVRFTLGIDLAMEVLFQYPELQAMADAIDGGSKARAAEPGERIEDPAASGRYQRMGAETTGATPAAGEVGTDAVTGGIDAVRADVSERLASFPRPQPGLARGSEGLVLLTGATGFVGAFVLAELVSRGHQVVCLLRSGRSMADIERNLAVLGLWRADRAELIEVVEGDVSEPKLGMAAGPYRGLAGSVGAIVNCAAAVNHVYPYEVLVRTNAHSAGPLLELASGPVTKRLAHVSTSAVANSVGYPAARAVPQAQLTALPPVTNGYGRSKAVAELYFEHAGEFGVGASVVRMPSVFGDRNRFQINPYDLIWNWTKAILRTGRYPHSFDAAGNELLQALPGDVAAGVIVDALFLDDVPGCRIVHAVPDAVVDTTDLIAAIRAAGTEVHPMDDRQWYQQVSTLDVLDVWVAGIAGHLAVSDQVAEPRRLRRFQSEGFPLIARAVESGALRTRGDLTRYIQSLTDGSS